tara:strand:- start:4 stop:186 length:183 start_codon:yes stop_codon:yes gene_type:complete
MPYILVKRNHRGHNLICALQENDIEFNWFGHDDEHDVIEIRGLCRSYDNAVRDIDYKEAN